MKVLLIGGSGLLGQHLKIEADRPSHANLDITREIGVGSLGSWSIGNKYDLIIHSAAYTNVQEANANKKECFDVNVNGTLNLLLSYPVTPFVFISSEYAHNPVNFYSLTKSLAEQLVTTHPHYLIIRTLFKPTPWKYNYAFEDQWTQGDYVDVIAPLIEKEIKEWDRKSKLIYVGTGRKTMFDLAQRTKLDVKSNSIKDMPVKIPGDYQ